MIRGFSLLELMVVLAITIMLFMGSFYSYKIYLNRIQNQQTKFNLYAIAEELLDYRQAKGTFEFAVLSEFKVYAKISKQKNFNYVITKAHKNEFEVCAIAKMPYVGNDGAGHENKFLQCKKICLQDTGEFNCS